MHECEWDEGTYENPAGCESVETRQVAGFWFCEEHLAKMAALVALAEKIPADL